MLSSSCSQCQEEAHRAVGCSCRKSRFLEGQRECTESPEGSKEAETRGIMALPEKGRRKRSQHEKEVPGVSTKAEDFWRNEHLKE